MSLGASVLSLCSFVHFWRQFKNFEPKARRLYLLAIAWILFSIVNLLARGWESRTMHTLGHLPYLLIPLLALKSNFEEPKLARILAFSSVALSVSVGISLYYWGFRGLPGAGVFRNPIYYAYAIFPAFLFFGELARKDKKLGFFTPRLSAFSCLLAFLGIVLSESRMILASALAYLFCAFLPKLLRRYGLKAAVIVVLSLGATATAIYSTQIRVQEKVQRTKYLLRDPSTHWRLMAWKHNWKLFADSPLVGTGAERNGIDVAKQPELAGHWDPGYLIFAHSIYFQSLADSGLVGTILYFGFFTFFAVFFPEARLYLALMGFVGLTENIFNNSKAALPFYYYLLLIVLALRKERASGPA